MRPNEFIAQLRKLNFEDAFNPYSDRCAVHDRDDAPRRRSDTLRIILDAATERGVDSIWIGRDLGFRGGRRTGLAFTDDANLKAHAQRWGLAVERPTKGEMVAERSAAVIWSILSRIGEPIFLWNLFPLHPHQPGDPFSNRCHTARERLAGKSLLASLVALLRPKRLMPIGKEAAKAVGNLPNRPIVVPVRHPSYGGKTQFLEQVSELYGHPGRNGLNPRARITPTRTAPQVGWNAVAAATVSGHDDNQDRLRKPGPACGYQAKRFTTTSSS